MHYEAEAQALIYAAAQKARGFGHSYVGSVHLLLALAEGKNLAGQLLRWAGFDPGLGVQLTSLL